MKLLYCKRCHDIFRLFFARQDCGCGAVSGAYLDNERVEYSGPAVPLGIANSSFGAAVESQPASGDGKVFDAFVIPKQCDTFVKVDDEQVS